MTATVTIPNDLARAERVLAYLLAHNDGTPECYEAITDAMTLRDWLKRALEVPA